MKVTFLGTGTSQGVPVIGCPCEVCQSTDARDKRLRTSTLVEIDDKIFVIDVGPDFRQQLLREKVSKVTAILITHEHNDHIIGMDDVRPLNFLHRKSISVFAEKRVQISLKERFSYIFDKNPYPGAPRLDLKTINPDAPILIGNTQILPIRVWHGKLPVLGFRFGDFAYLTDMNKIEASELEKLKGLKLLALDALHHSEHHSHFNLTQALELIKTVQPQQSYLIHISHRMGLTAEINTSLPKDVALAYDGLVVRL